MGAQPSPAASAAMTNADSAMPASTAALKNASRWSLANGLPRHACSCRCRRLLPQNTRRAGAPGIHSCANGPVDEQGVDAAADARVLDDDDVALLQVALGRGRQRQRAQGLDQLRSNAARLEVAATSRGRRAAARSRGRFAARPRARSRAAPRRTCAPASRASSSWHRPLTSPWRGSRQGYLRAAVISEMPAIASLDSGRSMGSLRSADRSAAR